MSTEQPVPKAFDEFTALLRKLFQIDSGDLDFGIYRILKIRRDEILKFIDQDLLPHVKKAFEEYRATDKPVLEKQLSDALAKAREFGVDPEMTPKVKEIRAQLEKGLDISALEAEVFSDLYTFFSRYYDEGDFISQRRYKDGVYSIPYEGEEVKLHWANHDQYYIKTSESFENYAFALPSGKRVRFGLKSAKAETDNNGTRAGNDKRFVLHKEGPLEIVEGELVMWLEYKADKSKTKQDDHNKETHDAVLRLKDFEAWVRELGAKVAGTDKTHLEKHLANYTTKNTFDYFIHKDLGGFLRRELDFFLKNEVLHIDDLANQTPERAKQELAKIKVLRDIADKIIDFLAQVEEFQKKLWLKKKFVLEAQYCLTLDKIPDSLYSDIAKNESQREEWVKLFAINDVLGYSKPLQVDFLRANKFLVLDTKHFDERFRLRLLSSIDDLDATFGNQVLNSENFHAMQILQSKLSNSVACFYLDPPFNTGGSGFVYKNGYQHSSWLSMISQSAALARSLLADDGAVVFAIDDFEAANLLKAGDAIFGPDNRLGILAIETKPSGRTNDMFLATSHEFALFYARNPEQVSISFFELPEAQQQTYKQKDQEGSFKWRDFLRTGGYSTPAERPNSFYPIYYRASDGQIGVEQSKGAIEILPLDSSGKNRVWRKTRPSLLEHIGRKEIQVKQGSGGQWKVYIKDYEKEGIRPKSVWTGAQYDASTYGTKLLKSLFGDRVDFSYPKSVHTVADCLRTLVGNDPDALIIDYFGGSGTTAHAVANLNREDGGNRRFVLVEMGHYFDTVLVPRVKKAIYSGEWKDGKPVDRQGHSDAFRYMRLESYEDALTNLELRRSQTQQTLLDKSQALRSEYMLKYLLPTESKGSLSLLKAEVFEDPFSYQMKANVRGETKLVTANLVETFNLLLGLHVERIQEDGGVVFVTGRTRDGQRNLIIWRKVKETAGLNQWFIKKGFNDKQQDFDVVYVNGSSTLASLRKEKQTWQVQLIEDTFHRLMFDVQDA